MKGDNLIQCFDYVTGEKKKQQTKTKWINKTNQKLTEQVHLFLQIYPHHIYRYVLTFSAFPHI